MQIIEYVVLFAFVVLASSGWGALACKQTKLPVCFLFMLGFAFLALLAYLVFFVFLLGPLAGWMASSLLGLMSLGVAAYQFARPEMRRNLLDADVWLPILLLFYYTASCLMVLLLHGGNPGNALGLPLPGDNVLPQILADRLWNGGPVIVFHGMTLARVNPFVWGWLSSDRPPLQAALYLLCRPFEFLGFNHDDIYRMTSTLFQATWLPAVYLLARQLQLTRYAMGLMLVWFAGSGFFLLHSIFTWPKLLSASLFLGGFSIMLYCANDLPKRNPAAVTALGLLWALALLAHGGILFSLLAVPLFPSAWRLFRASPWSILSALAVFVLVNLPWSAYQKFYDPPGNRLIKMHLAGVVDVDSRGSLEALRDAYTNLTFSQWLQNRGSNFKVSLFFADPQSWGAFRSVASFQAYLNEQCFFKITAALGLLNIGFVVLVVGWLRKKRHQQSVDTRLCELLLMNMGCYLIWIIMMFQPVGAVVHQGSFAMTILFMMIAIQGIAELPVSLGVGLLVGQWSLFAFIYLYFFYAPVVMNTAWFLDQGLYWMLMLLFIGSSWSLLPRTFDNQLPKCSEN